MLNLEDQYQENKSDFDEINNNLKNLGIIDYTLPKKQDEENGEKLSIKEKLIIFLCGFAYAGFLVFDLVWFGILMLFINDESTLEAVVTVCGYLTIFVVMIALAIKNKKYFLPKIKDPIKYLYGLIFAIVTIGIEIFVSYLMSLIYSNEINANQQKVIEYVTNYPTLMFFILVFIGPLCEEFTYRVGLYELLKEKNETLAFILSSVIFAFVHIKFTETTFIAEITSFPIYLTIGLCITYAYKKYGLPCSYITHVFLNLISFLDILIKR